MRLDRGESSLAGLLGTGVGFRQGAIQHHRCGLLILRNTARVFRIKPEVILRSFCRYSLLRYLFDDAHHPHLPSASSMSGHALCYTRRTPTPSAAKACRATEHHLALRIVLSQPCDSTKFELIVNHPTAL